MVKSKLKQDQMVAFAVVALMAFGAIAIFGNYFGATGISTTSTSYHVYDVKLTSNKNEMVLYANETMKQAQAITCCVAVEAVWTIPDLDVYIDDTLILPNWPSSPSTSVQATQLKGTLYSKSDSTCQLLQKEFIPLLLTNCNQSGCFYDEEKWAAIELKKDVPLTRLQFNLLPEGDHVIKVVPTIHYQQYANGISDSDLTNAVKSGTPLVFTKDVTVVNGVMYPRGDAPEVVSPTPINEQVATPIPTPVSEQWSFSDFNINEINPLYIIGGAILVVGGVYLVFGEGQKGRLPWLR